MHNKVNNAREGKARDNLYYTIIRISAVLCDGESEE